MWGTPQTSKPLSLKQFKRQYVRQPLQHIHEVEQQAARVDRAAKKLVKRAVHIDQHGFPSLRASAVSAIANARDSINPSDSLDEKVSAVREIASSIPTDKEVAKVGKQIGPGVPKVKPTKEEKANLLKSEVRGELKGLRERTGSKFKLPKLPSSPPRLRQALSSVQRARVKAERQINKQAELGNIEHPDKPRNATSTIGDLIPDTPIEIASLPVGGLLGKFAFRGVKTTARVASEAGAEAGGGAAGKVAGAKAVTGLAKETKVGKGLSKARKVSRSPGGRAVKLGAVGAAVGSGYGIPFVKGQVKGAVEHPGETAKTTARGLASIPAAGIGATAAGLASIHRLQEAPSLQGKKSTVGYALSPATEFIKQNWKQAKREVSVLGSKDPEKIAEATRKDYGVLPLIGAGALLRGTTMPAVRHVAARARGIEVPKGEPAPNLFPRVEEGTRHRMKVQASRSQSATAWATEKRSGAAMKEMRRLNTHFDPTRAKTKAGRKAHAVRTSTTRSEIGRKLDDLSKRTSTPVSPASLANMAAENPLFNYASRHEARAEAEAGLARSREGTPEHSYYQAVLEVPELFDEPQFQRAVSKIRDALGPATRQEDVRYFPVYEEHAKRIETTPPPRPSDAVPFEARDYTDASTREGAVGKGTGVSYRASEIRRERDELKAELRKDKPDQAKVENLKERIAVKREAMGPVKLTKEERDRVLAELPEEADATEKRAALQVAQQTKRQARDDAQLPALHQEFKQGAEDILAQHGKEGQTPVYFPHTDEERLNVPPPSPGFERAGTTADKERILGPGSVQSRGGVDYGAHRFAQAVSSHARDEAQRRFGGWLRDTITKAHDLGRGLQRTFNKHQLARLRRDGKYNPDTTYRVHAAFFDNPDRVPSAEIESLSSEAGGATQDKLNAQAQKIEQEGGGDTYYLVDRKDMDHYLATQKVMGNFEKKLSKLGTFESRAVLATSFAWMTAQVVAEGGLLLATQSPYRLARSLSDTIRLRGTEHAKHLAFISDAALGTDPIHGRMSAKSYQEAAAKGFDEAHKLPIDNYMRKLATFRYPGEWDRWKGGFLRDWYTVSEMDRQFNSRTRDFARGIGESWTEIDNIAHDLRGKTPEEQLAFLESPKGTKATEAFQTSLDRALGNWTAMGPAERMASHVVFFYPFLRFSVDWALRTYPADHPVRYTLATNMGQWNAEQLEHFLTKKPSFFTDWLQSPIYGAGEGHPTGFVSFSRVAPGSNALVEALGSSRSLGGVATSITRPTAAATLRGIFKYNAFGEYDPEQTLPKSLKDAVLGLSFPGRAARQYFDPSQTPGSPGRKEYALRSGVFPFYPEDYPSAKKKATMGELWNKVKEGGQKQEIGGARYTELSRKYQSWREEDEKYFGDKLKIQDFSLSNAKDIYRFTANVGPVNKADYREYLTLYLQRKRGREQSEQAKRRLVTLYGREGSPLTSSLKTFYHDEMDTGRSGPRAQRESVAQRISASIPIPAKAEDSLAKKQTDELHAAGWDFTGRRWVPPGHPSFGVDFSKVKDAPPADKRAAALGNAIKTGKPLATVSQAASNGAKVAKKGQVPGLKKDDGPWTADQAATLLYQVGATKREAQALSAYVAGESGGNPRATGPATSTGTAKGLFQIMDGVHQDKIAAAGGGNIYDPVLNAKVAVQVLRSQGLGAWEASPGQQGRVNPKAQQGQLAPGGGRTRAKFTGNAPPALKQAFNRAVRLADNLDKAEIPYGASSHVPGKSPSIREATSHDCSSAVSWLLQKMGVKIPVLVSGDLATTPALKNGPGALTVYANDGHTFMRIGNRYWGTSGSNPGRGPGWIDPSVMTPSYLSDFTVRHVPGFGPKQAKQLGAKLVGGTSGGGGSLAGGGGSLSGGGGESTSGGGSSSSSSSSATFKAPDYVGATRGISAITGITQGTGSRSASPRATSGFPNIGGSPLATLTNLPRLPSLSRRRKTRTGT